MELEDLDLILKEKRLPLYVRCTIFVVAPCDIELVGNCEPYPDYRCHTVQGNCQLYIDSRATDEARGS